MKIPKIIPPRSVVRFTPVGDERVRCADEIGREFRIGYYSSQDGLDCIWLVNEQGEYEQTTERDDLLRHYEILHLSDETDFFGEDRPVLEPLPAEQTVK